MSMQTRSYNLQYLNLQGQNIPLGGDNESARISFGDLTTVARARKTTIVQQETNPDVQLTISLHSEEPGYAILRAIIVAQITGMNAGARPPLSGSGGNLATGEIASWSNATILNRGDLVMSRDSEPLSVILALHGVEAT